jgi:hypothetical protein
MTFLNLSSGLMCTLVKRTGIYNVCKVYDRNTCYYNYLLYCVAYLCNLFSVKNIIIKADVIECLYLYCEQIEFCKTKTPGDNPVK